MVFSIKSEIAERVDLVAARERLLRHYAALASLTVGCLGIMVLTGWAFRIAVIKNLGQSVSMNPATAGCFLVAAGALWLIQSESLGRLPLWSSRALASAVVLVATLRLAQDALGLRVGIDRLLFSGQLNGNEMAPNTAVEFLLASLAMLLLPSKSRISHHVTVVTLLTAVAIAFFAVVGYTYGAKPLYSVSYFIPMALNTACGFLLLCSGILCARPDREPLALLLADSAGGTAARRLLPAAIVIPILLGWGRLHGQQLGLYGTELGTSLMVVSFALVFTALVWLNATLQHRADQERVRATQMLRDGAEAARAASRAKSEFLANMSHEIRTPMSAILGYADMLLDPELSASDRLDHVHTIRRNAEQLLTVLNDILDLSKIEAGKLQVERIATDPRQVVNDVLSLMRVRGLEKGIGIDVTYAGAIPRSVRTDPTRLRQILINLTGNAIKFTESGGVQVVVTLDRDQGSQPRLEFAVIDSGIGMDPRQMEQLFKPFEQADTSTTRKYGGTGLGLTICRRLARMLGGDISVQSRPGMGSRFTLTIDTGNLDGVPLLTESRESVKPQERYSQPERTVRLRGRVLLAEDGVHNQRVISFYLQKAGAEVVVAENGRVACERVADAKAQGNHFDVILMDMQMPELDGYTAAATLRSRGYEGPIIALTAHAMSQDRERCLKSGCSDYLSKPVDRTLLLSTLAAQMQGSCIAGTGAAATARPIQPAEPLLRPSSAPAPGSLRSTMAEDPDINSFLPEFVADLPILVGKLQTLLERQNLVGIREAVHQLKGSGGFYGFMPITDVADQVERLLGAMSQVEDVSQEVRRLIELIRSVEGYEPAKEGAAARGA